MTEELDIPVAISARHVHLTQSSIERLFGAGHRLQPRTPLGQPGQYAAQETVTLVGPRGQLPHVRVVGPPREADQVEISRTDELTLGIDAPVRLSGQIEQTPGVTLIGPTGRLRLAHGAILAQRHIHMNPEEAASLGLHDRQIVQVAVHGAGRELTFGEVAVRVSPHYRLELHLDTDEGNAAGLHGGDRAQLITPVRARARLSSPAAAASAPAAPPH